MYLGCCYSVPTYKLILGKERAGVGAHGVSSVARRPREVV